MKTLTIIFLICTSVFAQESKVNFSLDTQIDIATLKSEHKRESYCFFTSDSSSVGSEQLKSSSSELEGLIVQAYNKFGSDWLSRKLKWKVNLGSNAFSFNFKSENAYFSKEGEDDVSHCRSKVFSAKTSSQQTRIRTNAKLKLPNDVWIIKLKKNKLYTFSKVGIDFFNKAYIHKTQNGKTETIVEETQLENMNLLEDYQYFFINPATSEFENYLDIRISYANNSYLADNLDLRLDFQLIDQKYCLANYSSGGHKKDLSRLDKFIAKNQINNFIEGITCLMAPKYSASILKSINIYKISEFFESLDALEEQMISKLSTKDLILCKQLLNRARLYFSYFIVNEYLNLIKYKTSYDGKVLDGIQILSALSRTSIINLDSLTYELKSQTGELIRNDKTFIELSKASKQNLIIFHRLLLNELEQTIELSSKISSPVFLSLDAFKDLKYSYEKLAASFEKLNNFDLKYNSQKISTFKLIKLKEELTFLQSRIYSYKISWSAFIPSSKADDVFENYVELKSIGMTLFYENIKGLIDNIDYFFREHFVSDEFKKQYSDRLISVKQMKEEITNLVESYEN